MTGETLPTGRQPDRGPARRDLAHLAGAARGAGRSARRPHRLGRGQLRHGGSTGAAQPSMTQATLAATGQARRHVEICVWLSRQGTVQGRSVEVRHPESDDQSPVSHHPLEELRFVRRIDAPEQRQQFLADGVARLRGDVRDLRRSWRCAAVDRRPPSRSVTAATPGSDSAAPRIPPGYKRRPIG
jgi:hypothetical protein